MDKKPRTIEVPIVFDPAAEDAVARAKHAVEVRSRELLETFNQRVAVETALNPDEENTAHRVYEEDQATLGELTEALKAAQEALAAHTRVYTFRSLGFRAWRALKSAHPSKNKDEVFDLDSITPALLREAGQLTADQVEEILSDPKWSEGEVFLLVSGAVTVQS